MWEAIKVMGGTLFGQTSVNSLGNQSACAIVSPNIKCSGKWRRPCGTGDCALLRAAGMRARFTTHKGFPACCVAVLME
ncbi:hypothetical protein AMELA_G00077380 [Ameiurus melas]|uniref:Uncharacterized protein n=1 Tax=Ameiurus melas TaxID=219545 RepID=A0A7J6AYL9_AMEME|nr:hypothetical protein AMELA_G00077380 [Ameiurus melas]